MRDGRFIRKTTTVDEQDVGSQVDTLQRLMPKPSNMAYNLGTIKWRGKIAPVHMIYSNGTRIALIAEIASIGPRCVYRPIFNSAGVKKAAAYKTMTVEEKAEFMKTLEQYVDYWTPAFGNQVPATPFEVCMMADIPWNVKKYGPLLFTVVMDATASFKNSTLSGLKSFHYVETYMTSVFSKELRALDLVNHFDDGRVCMGPEFDNAHKGKVIDLSLLGFMQIAADSYNTSASNTHLFKNNMTQAWSLNPERTNVYGSNTLIKSYNLSLSFMLGLVA